MSDIEKFVIFATLAVQMLYILKLQEEVNFVEEGLYYLG